MCTFNFIIGRVSKCSKTSEDIPTTEEEREVKEPSTFFAKIGNLFRIITEQILKAINWKMFLGILLGLFVVTSVALTALPIVTQSNRYLKDLSTKRAVFLVKQLARINEKAVVEDNELLFSVRAITSAEGVIEARVVNADGYIAAPLSRSGEFVSKENIKEVVEEGKMLSIKHLQNSVILASIPIKVYSEEYGKDITKAVAQVKYPLEVKGLTDKEYQDIFITSLLISLALGILFFFILTHIVSTPLKITGNEIDNSMRHNFSRIDLNFKFPALNRVINLLNASFTKARDLLSSESAETGGAATPTADLLVNNVSDSILVLTTSNVVHSFNNAFSTNLADKLDQIDIGRNLNEVISDERFLQAINEVLEQISDFQLNEAQTFFENLQIKALYQSETDKTYLIFTQSSL